MRSGVSLLLLTGAAALAQGCSILYTRPVQEMSDTAAAIRAAREVQADALAPELYRQSNEWFFKSKKEYKLKNFKLARSHAEKARAFAEQAEFEAIRNGGNRTETNIPDPLAAGPAGAPPPPPPVTSTPKDTKTSPAPPPSGVLFNDYERMESEKKGQPSGGATPSAPVPPPPPP